MNILTQPYRRPTQRRDDNFAATIEQPFDLPSAVAAHAGGQIDLTDYLTAHPNGLAPLWALANNTIGPRVWGRLSIGDLVLFYGDRHVYAYGFVDSKVHWPGNDHVWPTGTGWDWIYSLADITSLPSERQVSTDVLKQEALPRFASQQAALHELHGEVPALIQSLLNQTGPPRSSSTSRVASTAVSEVPPMPPTAAAAATPDRLMHVLRNLRVDRQSGAPAVHQPLALVWAIARVTRGESRLCDWPTFKREVGSLLSRFGGDATRVTPEFPFWHLRNSGLWEVVGFNAPPDFKARPSSFDSPTIRAGFTEPFQNLLASSDELVTQAISVLRAGYLDEVSSEALFQAVGLEGYDTASGLLESFDESGTPERRSTMVDRVVRSTMLADRVKMAHDDACQVCGLRLKTASGHYSEAAHIRGLGRPHNGPDAPDNVLCLCPNHHKQFDSLSIYVDSAHKIWSIPDHDPVGTLHTVSGHAINDAHLRYHRALCGLDD